MRVLMIAAENGAIDGAKVGGMADVIRDLPPALMEQGVIADVMMPAYGDMASQIGAQWQQTLLVPFGDKLEQLELWLHREPQHEHQTLLVSHPSFDRIYHCDDNRPFATDANKFALFSAAVCHYLCLQETSLPVVVHLHDWHACFVAILARGLSRYQRLNECRLVLTIHNLSFQGVRPLQQDSSSLQAWFPDLLPWMAPQLLAQICDPHANHCVNPLRAGINLVDCIHVVSPTYAEEIQRPSAPQLGFFGGEGLEHDLQQRQSQLVGILNGCDYQQAPEKLEFNVMLEMARNAICHWMGRYESVRAGDIIALNRISQWQSRPKPELLLTSVGRLTDQKVLLLRQRLSNGQTVLQALLQQLQQSRWDARLLLLGSGDPDIAAEFRQIAGESPNLLFIDGFDEQLSLQVFAQGDVFLMPSSFEPCGISQLLAMRAGQVCLVHQVGGLKDTVEVGESGYGFVGESLPQQAQALLATIELMLAEFGEQSFAQLRQQALAQRFDWQRQIPNYIERLYRG